MRDQRLLPQFFLRAPSPSLPCLTHSPTGNIARDPKAAGAVLEELSIVEKQNNQQEGVTHGAGTVTK